MSLAIASDRCRRLHGEELARTITWSWQRIYNMDARMCIAWVKCDVCEVMHSSRAVLTADAELNGGHTLIQAIRDECICELQDYLAPGAEATLRFHALFYETMYTTGLKAIREATDGENGTPAAATRKAV